MSGHGSWRWSPDCDKKGNVEELMRDLSVLKPVEDEKKNLGAIYAHEEPTQRKPGSNSAACRRSER